MRGAFQPVPVFKGAEGSRFDIRIFHDKLPEDGTVPLPFLKEKIERWIAPAR